MSNPNIPKDSSASIGAFSYEHAMAIDDQAGSTAKPPEVNGDIAEHAVVDTAYAWGEGLNTSILNPAYLAASSIRRGRFIRRP